MNTPYPIVKLQPGRHKRVKAGHPWVYSNEVAMDAAAKALPPGSLIRLEAASGEALGVAMFNPHPLVAARLLSRNPRAAIDAAFVAERLGAALDLRERLYPGGFYRLIHAEADGLPGLVIDRFGAAAVVQTNAAGTDRLLPVILDAIETVLTPAVIVLRNDSAARTLEGLPIAVGVAKGSLSGPVELVEGGARFFADLEAGQKTGWFFDQRDNRAAVARLTAGGARVLDLYAYGGGFAVACARAGARDVLAVDRSGPALELAEHAARANEVAATCRFSRAEVFAELHRLAAATERFDVVIADPPAFVKSKKDLAVGSRGYRKLARLAAALVAPRGFLFVASCSHNVEPALFADLVRHGLADAERTGRVLSTTGASADHPVHPALPESAYLKAQLLQLD
ncbi:MAG: class I SAM-dependent rRNA methyltransferase [Proteobacteria bacterium]|nr:class I SAM-dependent rRNA methyltransferase [Pseudomonadota bacterium]